MARPSNNAGLRLPAFVAWPLLVAGLAAITGGAFYLGHNTAPPQIVSVGPRIEDIRRIARLAVLRVQVADVIEGRNAGARAVLLVKGDADIMVDFGAIEIADRNDELRTATLRLPAPTPERARVDHDRTRVYELHKTGLAAINPFADPRQPLLEDCMRAAQDTIRQSVRHPDFVTQAKRQAEVLLKAFYHEMGWDVTIEWAD